MQKASHRRELMNSKDDVMQKLAAAEANSIPIDEESVRRKYTKELDQIRVCFISISSPIDEFFCLFCDVFNGPFPQ